MPQHRPPRIDKTFLGCAWAIGIAIILFAFAALWFGNYVNVW